MTRQRRYFKEDPMLAEETTYADPALEVEEDVLAADTPGVQVAEIDAEIAGLNLQLEQCLAECDNLSAQIEALTAERDGIDAEAAAAEDPAAMDGMAADDLPVDGEDPEELAA